MNSRARPSKRAGSNGSARLIAILVIAWLAGSFALFLLSFDLSTERTPELQAELELRYRMHTVVLVAGPVVIAAIAAVVERPRTALALLGIALILLLVNL